MAVGGQAGIPESLRDTGRLHGLAGVYGTATGLRNTTRSPVAIRPARATVSAVRPSFPSSGPAGEHKSAARTATVPARPSSSRPTSPAGPSAEEAGTGMRDWPGSEAPWPRGSLTQIPQLTELRSYLTHNTPQLPDRDQRRPDPVAASPPPAHRNDRSQTCWPFTLARGLRAIRCEDVGTGSLGSAVAAGFGDARRLQALQGPISGSAAQPRAPHDALGGDVGGAAALVIAHLVVADAVVAARPR